MDLDATWNRPPELDLTQIIKDWLDQEHIKDFTIKYPDPNSTVMVGHESSIRYDHRTGYEYFGDIRHQGVYIDYEGEFYDAKDPEFFTKLKDALFRMIARHTGCTHLRDFND